jgi:hypothetical protein
MLMAGVLNSEVEKFCPASYRARAPGSKSEAQFSRITPESGAFPKILSTVSPEFRETFARSIGTFGKKG